MNTSDNSNTNTTNRKTVKIRHGVFWPTLLILLAVITISVTNNDLFLNYLNIITKWLLDNFAWAFSGVTVFCVITVIMVFISPLGKVRVGGREARPIMKYSNWVWISLTTTVAAGLLFFASAEPIIHLYAPPMAAGVEPGTVQAAMFAMKVLFLEWTFMPYALYTVASLAFCFAYYNMKAPGSFVATLTPLYGDRVHKYSTAVDIVCGLALSAGMAASMGICILSISGGVEMLTGIKSNSAMWAVVAIVTGCMFTIASITGIMKGIKNLSFINVIIFFIIAAMVLIFGKTSFVLNTTTETFGAFIAEFPKLALMTGELYGDDWARNWPCFYYCNWMSWAPITAVFLGKIAKGYTIRDTIKCNFIIPSLFSGAWIGLFSSSALYYELDGRGIYDMMQVSGTESAIYEVLAQLPVSTILIPLYLIVICISFVTACDSNTTALSGLCIEDSAKEENHTAPVWIQLVWGATITFISYIIISSDGLEGIKALSNLGGFPVMFLEVMVCLGLWKIARKPAKYDTYKEDYDKYGDPIPSERLESEEMLEKQKMKERKNDAVS